MKKLKTILLLILIAFSITQVKAFNFEVKSDKVILINTTDNIILFEKNDDEKTSIASLTKIITAITTLDNVDDINKKITISYNMLKGLDGYSKAGFKIGKTIPWKILISPARKTREAPRLTVGSIKENLLSETSSIRFLSIIFYYLKFSSSSKTGI